MLKKMILIITIILVTTVVSFLLVRKIELIREYEKIEKEYIVKEENMIYEGFKFSDIVVPTTHSVNGELFFEADKNYILKEETEKEIVYYSGDKFITIATIDTKINDFSIESIKNNTSLKTNEIKKFLESNNIMNQTDLNSYALKKFNDSKVNFFSSTNQIKEKIILTKAISEFDLDENERSIVLSSKFEGIWIKEGINDFIKVSKNNSEYHISFSKEVPDYEVLSFINSIQFK